MTTEQPQPTNESAGDASDVKRVVRPDGECICHGNWRAIVKEMEPLIGREYKNRAGDVAVFFGLVHGADDYYYGMAGPTRCELLSCVGAIEGYGYSLVPNTEVRDEHTS